MSNLGAYQDVVTMIKKLGGPRVALPVVIATSYAVGRGLEAGVRKTVKEIRKRNAPCATKDRIFTVVTEGQADGGPRLRTGDKYRVLECDGDAVLIEVLENPDNPYFVSGNFLAAISDFPAEKPNQDE